jgi:hypothetical protein
MTINAIAKMVHENAVAHGFHPEGQLNDTFMADQLLNLHREVSELSDARRSGILNQPCDKADGMRKLGLTPLTNIEEEYADIVIRALDQMARFRIDVERVILTKHEYNKTRPFRHNKLN